MKTRITTLDGIERVTAVRKNDAETFDAGCSCGFKTYGWEKKAHAEARMTEHQDEHETGEPTPELYEFRQAKGLNGSPPAKPSVEWDDV